MKGIEETDEPLFAFADLAELMFFGLAPAEAIDFFATVEGGYSQAEWARARGVTPQSVCRNVRGAKEKLQILQMPEST